MMVRQDEPAAAMGQVGFCSPSTLATESFPSAGSIPVATANSANGTASEVQASLSNLLSCGTSLSQEDLIAKLTAVVSENLELKEAVAQNNLALRQQLSLVVRWSQQCEQQQRLQRQQVAEVSQQLSAVQQENSLLKAQLSGAKNAYDASPKFKELDDTIQLLSSRFEASEHNLREVRDEKEKLLIQRTRHEGDITLLKCDLTAARSEQERLQLERFELRSTISDLRQQVKVLKEKDAANTLATEACAEYDNQLKKLQYQLEKEQETSAALLQELQDTRSQVEVLESEITHAKEEVVKHQARYNELRHEREKRQSIVAVPVVAAIDLKKTESGSAEIRRLRDEVALLKEEVDTLEAALTEERQKAGEERSAVTRMHNELNRTRKELQDAKDQHERNHHTDQYYQVKLKSVTEQYDEVTAKLLSYEELLASKNDEIGRYKKQLGQAKAQLAEMKSEGETIAVLRAQVEVYQADFRAEREAREALAADREKLRDELRALHTRNTQLVDEIESYQRQHFRQESGAQADSQDAAARVAEVGKDQPSLTAELLWKQYPSLLEGKQEESKKDEGPELDENLFYCPKCNKSFTQIRPLEEHANRCLDED